MYELDCPHCSKLLSATSEQLGRQSHCPLCSGALLIQLPGDVLPNVYDMELGPEPRHVFARDMPPPPPPPPLVPAEPPAPVVSPEISS